MTADLVAFLNARLDEDEAAARFATAGPWADDVAHPIRGGRELRFVIAQQVQRWNSQHIARHDPARVLAEVEAKQRIIKLHQPRRAPAWDIPGQVGYECRQCATEHPCTTLRLLALPYADHPGYRPEWAPEA